MTLTENQRAEDSLGLKYINFKISEEQVRTSRCVRVSGHSRYVVLEMAEVAIPRQMFREILQLIADLGPRPPPRPA